MTKFHKKNIKKHFIYINLRARATITRFHVIDVFPSLDLTTVIFLGSQSTFYRTTEEPDSLLVVDLEPVAVQPDPAPLTKPTRPPPPKPNDLLVPENHKTINDIARKTIRLLKSEVTHVHFEHARRDLIGSSLMESLYFLTDTEGKTT